MTGLPASSGLGKSRRLWLSLLVIAIVAVSVTTPVDRYAETDLDSLFRRALITFAMARTLNGVISAVQGTEIALQPAGVGVTLTPGEILDPVNDLVERFSWIMLGATISLGAQRVFLDIGQWWGLRLLLAISGLTWLWLSLRSRREAFGSTQRILLQTFFVLLFLRFAVPLTLIANDAVFELFLSSRYQESTAVIETAGAEIERAGSADTESGDVEEQRSVNSGLLEMLGRALESTRESLNVERRIESIKQRAGDVIEHVIQLSVVFILQTAIVPLVFLWGLLQGLKVLIKRKI